MRLNIPLWLFLCVHVLLKDEFFLLFIQLNFFFSSVFVVIMSLIRYNKPTHLQRQTVYSIAQWWRDTRKKIKESVRNIEKRMNVKAKQRAREWTEQNHWQRLLSVKFYCAFISYTHICVILSPPCVECTGTSIPVFHFNGINAFNMNHTTRLYSHRCVAHVNGCCLL